VLVHVNPFPVKPGLQVHVKLPVVFVQVALVSQPPLFVAHSLMSVQLPAPTPFPWNPGLQAQVRPPGTLVQTAFVSQPPLFVRHSLMSLHVTPLPV
jgi:hypothetical protein